MSDEVARLGWRVERVVRAEDVPERAGQRDRRGHERREPSRAHVTGDAEKKFVSPVQALLMKVSIEAARRRRGRDQRLYMTILEDPGAWMVA